MTTNLNADLPRAGRFHRALKAVLDLMDSDATRRLWACDVAEAALGQLDAGLDPDPRSTRAIEVSRRYARGAATREELDAASQQAELAWRTSERGSVARGAAFFATINEAAQPAWATAYHIVDLAVRLRAWSIRWGACVEIQAAESAIVASAARVVDAGAYIETEIDLM